MLTFCKKILELGFKNNLKQNAKNVAILHFGSFKNL